MHDYAMQSRPKAVKLRKACSLQEGIVGSHDPVHPRWRQRSWPLHKHLGGAELVPGDEVRLQIHKELEPVIAVAADKPQQPEA